MTIAGSNTNDIVREIEATLDIVKGVVGLLRLSKEDLQRIQQLEENDEQRMYTGATGGCNEGVREVLRRDLVFAIAKTSEFPQAVAPTVTLVSNGEIVGEEVVDSKKAETLKNQPGIVFVGEKFVLYRDRVRRHPANESTFLFPPLPFPLLKQMDRITDVVSASPAASTDLYVKSKGGWNVADVRLGTILVGFNLV